MAIKLINGDIFSSQASIIAHGVNAQGRMNAGIAKQIRQRFPQAYADYMTKFKTTGWSLGDTQLVMVGESPRFIANCCTQEFYGRDGFHYCDYDAIENCLATLFRFASREGCSIAMPRLGCGLGGGDWNIVFDIIKKVSLNYPGVAVEIYSLESASRSEQ